MAGEVLKQRNIRPPKVEFEFTDQGLTAFGRASILAWTARLFELLEKAVSVKMRDRGASDARTLWTIIASLARGHGSLSDLDALRADGAARALLGLKEVPEARRAEKWLSRLGAADVKGNVVGGGLFRRAGAPAIIAAANTPAGDCRPPDYEIRENHAGAIEPITLVYNCVFQRATLKQQEGMMTPITIPSITTLIHRTGSLSIVTKL